MKIDQVDRWLRFIGLTIVLTVFFFLIVRHFL